MKLPGVLANLPTRLRTAKGVAVLVVLVVADLGMRACTAPAKQSSVRVPESPPRVARAVEQKHTLADDVTQLQAQWEQSQKTLAAWMKTSQEERTRDTKLVEDLKQQVTDRDRQLREQRDRYEAALKQMQQTAGTPHQPVRQVVTKPVTQEPHPPAQGAFQLRTLRPEKTSTRQLAQPVNNLETAYLPETCFAGARLVTGASVGAPGTGAKWGYPLLYSLTDAFTCPWHLGHPGTAPTPSGIPIQGCFVLAHAEADLAASRAMVATDRIACVMPSGEAFSEEIKGYAVGRDGMLGMFGQVERHASAEIAKATLVGLLQEMAGLIALAKSQVIITPGYGSQQPFRGFENTLTQVSQYFIAQARMLQPTLSVYSGDTATLVLQKPLPLPGYPVVAFLRGAR